MPKGKASPAAQGASRLRTPTGQPRPHLVRLEAKRRDLERRYGLTERIVEHFRRPVERPFVESERGHTTVLLGGLSPRHDTLVQGALQGLGYNCRALPNTTLESYTIGKEYGNNGLCCPTYFTVGNLVKYLQDLEAGGLSRQEIIENHVFVTAGSCGTCRFGMYEAEYRLALENAGFEGFRVLLFGTDDGIDQSNGERAGLEMNLDFFLALVSAFNAGDVLNQLMYKIRPYEVEPGSVDAATTRVLRDLRATLASGSTHELADHWTRVFLGTRFEGAARYVAKILHQMRSDEITDALRRARDTFDQVELDPFRVRPVVKLIGEFWVQTTEGDGNFNMHRFLEGEGAEVYVDRTLFTRLSWIVFLNKVQTQERRGIRNGRSRWDYWTGYYKKVGLLSLAERILRRENDRLITAIGGGLHPMVDQYAMERIARPYWNWRTTSGESHLEIAENIYYHTHHLCHMTLSVKPFSCMPSTQSDGVQARVVEDHPGMIFLPIETSGDGEVIAHSRVQMALGGARTKAREEMARVLEQTTASLDDMKSFADDHPELKRASYEIPHHPGVVGRAANFALHVDRLCADRPTAVPVAQEM